MKKTITLLAFITGLGFVTKAQIINTIAGIGTKTYSGDNGQATAAGLYYPIATYVDPATNNIYICDNYNNAVRMINPAGVITTVAGTGAAGYNGDNIQATAAELDQPISARIDASGNLIIADAYNNRVRMVNKSGIITTIAGTGTGGYAGDNGQATAAELHVPSGIAIDATGNIFISDAYNYVIRKINTLGVITTVSGTHVNGYNGDGIQATTAEMGITGDIFIDKANNLYIPDVSNSRLRKVNAAGIITTIAGTTTAGYNGDGIQATTANINGPSSVSLDSIGNIYFTDELNERIRMINTSGIVSTIAGNGTTGYNGDGIQATSAELNKPHGIWVNKYGSIYISDYWNNRVRAIYSSVDGISKVSANESIINLFPNPSNGIFNLTIGNYEPWVANSLEVYSILGEKVCSSGNIKGSQFKIDLNNQPNGVYFVRVKSGEKVYTSKIIIAK